MNAGDLERLQRLRLSLLDLEHEHALASGEQRVQLRRRIDELKKSIKDVETALDELQASSPPLPPLPPPRMNQQDPSSVFRNGYQAQINSLTKDVDRLRVEVKELSGSIADMRLQQGLLIATVDNMGKQLTELLEGQTGNPLPLWIPYVMFGLALVMIGVVIWLQLAGLRV